MTTADGLSLQVGRRKIIVKSMSLQNYFKSIGIIPPRNYEGETQVIIFPQGPFRKTRRQHVADFFLAVNELLFKLRWIIFLLTCAIILWAQWYLVFVLQSRIIICIGVCH